VAIAQPARPDPSQPSTARPFEKEPVTALVDEEVLDRFYDGRLMRRLITYLRPYRAIVLGGIVFLGASALLQVIGPLLTKLAVDRYMAPVPGLQATIFDRWLPQDRWTGIAFVSGVYLAVLILTGLCDFAHGYLMQRVGQHAMSDLRQQLMRHLQALDVEFFDRNPVGRLVTRATSDVDALNELFTSGLVSILGDMLMLVLIAFAMLRLSPPLTALILIVTPFVVLATMKFRSEASYSYRRIRITVARINAYLQEHINGMTVVQLFNREARSVAQFDRINGDNKDAYKDAIFASSWFNPVVEFQGMLALSGLLAFGGFQTRHGALTLGVLVAFFQYALRFFRPIQELSDKYNVLQSAVAASEKIFALLDTPAAIVARPRPHTVPGGPVAIEFDHVWFAYKADEWVLRDVSFTILPGQAVAVVGHTGAGKTTLSSLLLRFYDIQRGSIRVGGIDIREFDPVELRRRFGVVLQDPHLFTGTISDNIRLGTPGITDEQILDSVDRVNLREFIDSLPGGFAEPVRERGHGLSVGQKQLISFARALAHNPPYLILDEATSSVDTDTEMRVRAALGTILEGRTAIIIAHRLSTIQRADCILVMHKGRLREQGTHQELLACGGIYWKLYRLQFTNQDATEQVMPASIPLDTVHASMAALAAEP
jgi:ATP-binding cassette subfamily B protein